MINKVLHILLITALVSSCGGNKGNKVHSISFFTPKLSKEATNFQPIINEATEINKWPGIDSINEVSSNIKINSQKLKFLKSNLKLRSEAAVPPVIVDNQMFLLDITNAVYCFDLNDKTKVWQRDLGDVQNKLLFSGSLTVCDDKIFVTNLSKEIIILEKATGYELSRIKLNDIILHPITYDQKNIYAIVSGNQVLAFNKNNYSLEWQVGGVENDVSLTINSFVQPVIVGSSLLVPTNTGDLISIDRQQGSSTWYFTPPQNSILGRKNLYANLTTQVIADAKSIILPYAYGYLIKLDISDTKQLWTKEIYDILSMNRFGNFIVLTTNAQQVAAISDENGEILWTVDLVDSKKDKGSYKLLTPIMLDGIINIFSSQGKVYQINTEGSLINSLNIPPHAKFYAINGHTIYLLAGKNIWYYQN